MAESAALLVDDVLPQRPMRQWVLSLDGVYIKPAEGKLRFRQTAPPTTDELQALLHRITHRVARYLERKGLLERDAENSYLHLDGLDGDAGAMPDLYGHSITYRIALGPQRGRKVFSLQTLRHTSHTKPQAGSPGWPNKQAFPYMPGWRHGQISAINLSAFAAISAARQCQKNGYPLLPAVRFAIN
jgi:hypothetical protein